MHVLHPLPWWLGLLVAAALGGLSFVQYRQPLRGLTPLRRATLAACRLLALGALVALLLRPISLAQSSPSHKAILPVLVDVSRSMRIRDAGGRTRIQQAIQLLEGLVPALSAQYDVHLYAAGDRLEPVTVDRLTAEAPHSDLSVALAAVRDRYRGQPVAGIVLLSDGADTGRRDLAPATASDPPVFAVGLGSVEPLRDREVTTVAVGEQRLDETTVDLRVSAVSTGYGSSPFVVRVLSNGREVDRRRVSPVADGAPVEETFTVSPDPSSPTVYTVDIAVADGEQVTENNSQTVLVNPVGRRRRLLVVEGAPGFEHSFLTRAWKRDPSLLIETVSRKGRDPEGRDTFYVQAEAGHAAALVNGFPSRREDLYAYDALMLANVGADLLTRTQLTMAADFVGERGGGLLVLGSESFGPHGLSGTALDPILPIDLREQGRMPAPPMPRQPGPVLPNQLQVTADGERHPSMRIGRDADETAQLWSTLPALASTVPLGGPRPGATVLAVAAASTGAVSPAIVVQRFGRGRSLVFAGEASWRWRMLLPSTDHRYEYFWRQAARWISGSTPEAVMVWVPDVSASGDILPIGIEVRDAEFAPVADAVLDATVTAPDGHTDALMVRSGHAADGQYAAEWAAPQPGLYRVHIDARRGTASLGQAVRWIYVGGVDREFADPRMNEAWLRRAARASAGRFLYPAEASRIGSWLSGEEPRPASAEWRDAWHEPWVFGSIVALLCGEWTLRRRWGLR